MQKNTKIPSLVGSRFYRIWGAMRRRCEDKKFASYPNYGGRGIIVCKRWQKFENFRRDLFAYYLEHCDQFGEKNTTIDRIRHNDNYCPDNVKWATWDEQAKNRRPAKRKLKQMKLFTK